MAKLLILFMAVLFMGCDSSAEKKEPKEYTQGISPEVRQLDEEIKVLEHKLKRHQEKAHKEEFSAQQDFLNQWGTFSDKMEEREEEEFKAEIVEKQIDSLKARREKLLNRK